MSPNEPSIMFTRYLVKTFSARSVKPRSKWVLKTTPDVLDLGRRRGGRLAGPGYRPPKHAEGQKNR